MVDEKLPVPNLYNEYMQKAPPKTGAELYFLNLVIDNQIVLM